MKLNAFLDTPGTRIPYVPFPDHMMENDFYLPIPYTWGYSATLIQQILLHGFPNF